MVTHARAFYQHATTCVVLRDHPTLEQFCLTMLATMIGFKQHHSYEEAMFPLYRFEHGSETLEYRNRKGYRDIIDSSDPFIFAIGQQLVDAALTIAKDTIKNFSEIEPTLDPPVASYIHDVTKWYETATGKSLNDYL